MKEFGPFFFSLRLCLIGFLLVTGTNAFAQLQLSTVCQEKYDRTVERDPIFRLTVLNTAGCLGGNEDQSYPLIKQLDATAVPAVGGSPMTALDKRLDVIISFIRAQTPPASHTTVLDRVRTSLVTARLELKRVELGESVASQSSLGMLRWEWDPVTNKFRGFNFGVADMLRAVCAGNDSVDACNRAIVTGALVLRVAHVTRKTLEPASRPEFVAAAGKLRTRDARWTGYFFEARPQYPWELWANGKIHARQSRKANGFAEVPNWQLILLHPGVGFEYVDKATDGNQFEPAVFIEIVGANFWQWSESNKPDKALGASFIKTYSDRAGIPDIGWGLMFHWRHRFSVAVTRRSGGTGVMVTTDVLDWFTTKESELSKLKEQFE